MSTSAPLPSGTQHLSATEILELIPQRPPFRFVDSILEVDEDHIVASYRFRKDEFFYRGHFPENPITPGVILLETMAQAGVVALGIYLLALHAPREEARRMVTLFTDAQVEFNGVVRPGDEVVVEARKVFFRRSKLRVEATMRKRNGGLVCSGTLAGMGVSPR